MEILDLMLLKMFKMPYITPYTGKTNPILHINLFKEMMMMQDLIEIQMCYPFALTLEERARKWYKNMRPSSIGSFNCCVRYS